MKTIIRDKKHLEYIRELPCARCGNHETQACHIRKHGDGGVGIKPSDNRCLPLCYPDHLFQHRVGELEFYKDVNKAIQLANGLYLFSGDIVSGINLIMKMRDEVF